MAIRIEDGPEPLSERSLNPTGAGQPLLIESETTRVLRQELERYCRGEITGRSFLIAGHRGAGKTTLVAKAFLDTWLASERKGDLLRPLFIPLHGPSLFPPLAPEPAKPKPPKPPEPEPDDEEDGEEAASDPARAAVHAAVHAAVRSAVQATAEKPASKPAAKPEPPKKSEAQVALEQITLGLHRAVTREFVSRYYGRITDLAYLRHREDEVRQTLANRRAGGAMAAPGVPFPSDEDLDRLLRLLPPDREIGALAAQFEIELYDGPSPQRLHELWARVDSVSGGVLFQQGYAPIMRDVAPGALPTLPAGLRLDAPGVHGQGIRELVALSGVVDAFRRISGDVKRADKQRDETTHEEERGHKFELAGKELVAPAVAVLTGALAGVGTAASTGKPFTALVGGVVAALGAGLVFKVSTSRKRARSLAREEQFIPDLSVATLDRVLPLLIERLREAGLAPVFVVDELDKVQRLNERILEMVHHLKKLVAENAFFCFLANRSYFEEMLARSAGRAYPVEYTYYTHRLFVTFGPEDYERYLRKRMPDPEPSPAPAVAASGALEAAAVADTREPVACTLLRWVVRHRAQLHAVDLQREIAALRGESNEVAGEVDEIVTSQRNRIDATFQVAIELRLAQKEVQQAVRDRPELRRLLYDAMYYLTRRWLEGATEIDLTPKEPKQPNEAFDAFVKYLEGRTGREEERPADDGGAGAAAAGDAKATHGLQPGDCEFLYGQVGLLADFLSDRPGATSGAGAVAAPAPAAASAASVSTGVPAAVASGAGASPPDWRRQQRDDWNTARAKRQLPPVDGNLWDVLLLRAKDSQAPDSLLVRPDDAPKAWVYHFRYDRTSATPRPLAAAARREEAGEAMPKAALAQQREQPMVVAQLVVVEQPILGAITFISIVSGVIDALQREDPKAGAVAGESLPISLDTLASRYNVIAPSPAWSVVDAAIDRLADAHSRGARYPTQGEDELYVAQFRELLARNLLRIGNALACAAFVGRGRSTSRAARLARGLTVLSRARRFAQRDEEAVGLALEDLTVQVRDAFAVDLTIEWDGAMATYQSAVGAAIDRAEGPLSEQARETLDHVADRAWSGLLDRLERWMSGAPPGAPEVVELLAAAAELGPSKVMGFDPAEMTICDWVRVLAGARGGAAKAPPAPTWLGPIALHALGFHGVNPDLEPARLWLRWPRSGQVGIPDLDEWTRVRALRSSAVLFSGPSPTTTLVVVRRTNSSPKLTTILPMPGIATLIATVDELESIVGNDPAVPPLPLIAPTERQVVAVEMEPELQSKLESELYPRISVAMNPLLVHVYWQDRGREMRHPYVVNPASLMEIVEAAVKENVRLPRKSAPTA